MSGTLGKTGLIYTVYITSSTYKYYLCLLQHTTDVTMASVSKTVTMIRIFMVELKVSSRVSLGSLFFVQLKKNFLWIRII